MCRKYCVNERKKRIIKKEKCEEEEDVLLKNEGGDAFLDKDIELLYSFSSSTFLMSSIRR